MAQFGKTVSVTGMHRLSSLLAANGYTGINALSFLSIKTDDPSVPLKLYITEDGVHAPGVSQVITATVVGTVTTAGAVKWELTFDGLPGSPLEVLVDADVDDDDETVAAKSVAAFLANDDIRDFFLSIEADDEDVVFTKYPGANDATANAAYDNDTSEGLTAGPTSTETTEGSEVPASDGIEILDDVFMIGNGSGKVIDAGMAWVVPESGTLSVEFAAQEVGA